MKIQKHCIILSAMLVIIPLKLWAETGQSWLEIMALTSNIKLSELHSSFDDVSTGNMGSFFGASPRLGSFFTIGGGAIFMNGNSKDTDILIAGGGLLLDFTYGENLVLSVGTLLGGANVVATQKVESISEENNIDQGNFYNGGGFLTAPYLGIGLSSESIEFRLMVKQLNFGMGSKQITAFDSTYAGLGMIGKL